jgi:hypothetical protein
VRVYMIGRDYQATDIDTGEVARRFLSWLADDANAALTEVIQTWLCQPPDSGGLEALAESAWDVAQLRAGVIAVWRPEPGDADGPVAR